MPKIPSIAIIGLGPTIFIARDCFQLLVIDQMFEGRWVFNNEIGQNKRMENCYKH